MSDRVLKITEKDCDLIDKLLRALDGYLGTAELIYAFILTACLSLSFVYLSWYWLTFIYLLTSTITYKLFKYDKFVARYNGASIKRNKKSRTSENLLHMSELLGGWPGALVAQSRFRHKTKKLDYKRSLFVIISLHIYLLMYKLNSKEGYPWFTFLIIFVGILIYFNKIKPQRNRKNTEKIGNYRKRGCRQ